MVVEVAAQSVNRAYVPLSMRALKSRDPHELAQLELMGSLIVAAFCLLGAFVGAFSREIVGLFTAPGFEEAATVVPVLVFSGAASAAYYLFVSVLFFDRSATKLLPVGTLTGAVLNVGLALALIPRFGMIGAGVAALLAQLLATILVAVIGRHFDPVRWSYARYCLAFVSSLGCALWLSGLEADSSLASVATKLGGLLALCALLGLILWGRPLILCAAGFDLLRGRPGEAVALFQDARQST
jgi:O-antigen/teichoic acid export membrane protein